MENLNWPEALKECEKLGCRWLCTTGNAHYCSALRCCGPNKAVREFEESLMREKECIAEEKYKKEHPFEYLDYNDIDSVQACADWCDKHIALCEKTIEELKVKKEKLSEFLKEKDLPF